MRTGLQKKKKDTAPKKADFLGGFHKTAPFDLLKGTKSECTHISVLHFSTNRARIKPSKF